MSDLESIIKEIDRLKPIPQVTTKIMSIIEDPHGSLEEISKVILYDQTMTANLLKVCNSAYFGLTKKIDSVHRAIVYLGIDKVVDLVLLLGIAGSLKNEHRGYDLQAGELWKYSVASALIAEELAARKGLENKHLVFTGALLKDIGKVVLSKYVDQYSDKIHSLVTDERLSFREAEREVIGIDHAELGGLVAEHWNFDAKLTNIIRNHHLTDESSMNDLDTCIVYLADTLCMMIGIGGGSDGLAYRFHKQVVQRLNLSARDMQEAMASFVDRLEEVETLLGLS